MAYTMATNRHITPKPGHGWREWADWVDASELAPGLGRPELDDRVPPRVRQRLGDPGEDEQDGRTISRDL